MIKNSLQSIQPESSSLNGIYRGVVEDNKNDPEKAGRVKVRIFGVHTEIKEKTETEGIPTDELPWAEPALSLFEGSVSGKGSFTVPLQGSHVFLFFENGNPMKPIYFASSPGIPQDNPDSKKGFNDPDEQYPSNNRLSEPDFDRLSRGEINDTVIEDRNNFVKKDISYVREDQNILSDNNKNFDVNYESWDEPESAYNTEYPHNIVMATHGDLVIEVDSTPNNRRFHIYHPSNTYLEIDEIGNVIFRNANDKIEIIDKDYYNSIYGNSNKTIGKNKREFVKGFNVNITGQKKYEHIGKDNFKKIVGHDIRNVKLDSDVKIEQNYNLDVTKNTSIHSLNSIKINSPVININSMPAYSSTQQITDLPTSFSGGNIPSGSTKAEPTGTTADLQNPDLPNYFEPKVNYTFTEKDKIIQSKSRQWTFNTLYENYTKETPFFINMGYDSVIVYDGKSYQGGAWVNTPGYEPVEGLTFQKIKQSPYYWSSWNQYNDWALKERKKYKNLYGTTDSLDETDNLTGIDLILAKKEDLNEWSFNNYMESWAKEFVSGSNKSIFNDIKDNFPSFFQGDTVQNWNIRRENAGNPPYNFS